jgi:hypothetical protein
MKFSINIKYFIMRQLSIILFIGLLIILPSCKYFRASGLFGKRARTLAVLKAQEDSIRVADSLQKITDQLKAIENAKLDSVRKAVSRLKQVQDTVQFEAWMYIKK